VTDQPKSPDTGKLAMLLMRHQQALYGYLLACVRNQTDADDLMQSVAVAVFETHAAPLGDQDFLRWAREIARRRVLEYFRTRPRAQPVDPRLFDRLAEAADWVERAGGVAPRREWLLDCIEKLPPENRELLAARYGEAAAQPEQLATRFGRSVQGIYSLLYRIRQMLRACVERRLAMEGRS
jgi:RNA polymerase sigma-70 factor (ECF subfamily)